MTNTKTRRKVPVAAPWVEKDLEEMTMFSIRHLAAPMRPGPLLAATELNAKIREHRFIDFDERVPEITKYLLGAVTTFYYEHWIKAAFMLQGVQSELAARVLLHLKGEYAFFLSFIMGPFSFSEAVQELKSSSERGDPAEILIAAERFMLRARRLVSECRLLLDLASRLPEVRAQKGAGASKVLREHRDAAARLLADFS